MYLKATIIDFYAIDLAAVHNDNEEEEGKRRSTIAYIK